MTSGRFARLWPVALIAVLGLTRIAAARPGGGDSYSGGGGHSGSSGGGGSGALIFELVYWLFQIVFAYPAIGLPKTHELASVLRPDERIVTVTDRLPR
jgi:hypothetical protein